MTSVTLDPIKRQSAIGLAEEMHREHYRENPEAPLFIEMLGLYLRHGFVISTPSVFTMFRPVVRAAPAVKIADPAINFKNPDAWFIYAAVSEPDGQYGPHEALKRLAQLAPFPLPFICFYRKWGTRLRIYRTTKLFGRIYGK